jgi:hypothetical protein
MWRCPSVLLRSWFPKHILHDDNNNDNNNNDDNDYNNNDDDYIVRHVSENIVNLLK